MRRLFTLCSIVLAAIALPGQTNPQPDPPSRDWNASWITHPTAPLREPIVLHFRRLLKLGAVPASYVVRVSADNRFILYVNGTRVGDGPARGDLGHWRYERFDLAPLLKAGENLITATVWNWGVYAPVAQMSDRTAFLLESEATGDASISTPDGWMVEQEPGHRALDRSSVTLQEYFASGPGEEIDAAKYDWGWNSPAGPGPGWVAAGTPMRDSIFPGVNKAHSAEITGDNFWGLVPDGLPPMEYSATAPGEVVRIDPASTKQSGLHAFPAAAATVPGGSHIHLILDRKDPHHRLPPPRRLGRKGCENPPYLLGSALRQGQAQGRPRRCRRSPGHGPQR